MHEWSRPLVSLCWRQGLRSGTSCTIPLSLHQPWMTPTILTQTAIWHVTVRGSNATADRCTLAHYATSVGNITPQWQPSASARWVARTQAANPVPPPQPTRSPNPSSVRKHLLSPLYHFHIVDLLVVDSYICSCHSCIVVPPLCCALMTFGVPCTTPQTHPTKLALVKGEDDRSQVRRA